MEVKDALHKRYQIRFNVKGRKSLVVAFPYEVVERESRKQGMTVNQFIENFQAVAQYDSFDGVHYTFEEIENNRQPD